MVVQGVLDHCSISAQTSVSLKTGLLGKAAMRSIYLEFQALKPRELFNAAASLSLYILLIVSSSYYCIYQQAVMLLFLYGV